jgi:hypothetical protein
LTPFVVFILFSDSHSFFPSLLFGSHSGHLIPSFTHPLLPRLFSVLYSYRPLILVECTNEPSSCCNTSIHRDGIPQTLPAALGVRARAKPLWRPGCTARLLPGRCSVTSSLTGSTEGKDYVLPQRVVLLCVERPLWGLRPLRGQCRDQWGSIWG